MSLNFFVVQTYIKSKRSFPVPFKDFFSLIGFSRKDVAKRCLLSQDFVQGKDFEIVKTPEKPGRPDEQIRLTVDCAKKFALITRNSEGKEIYELFQKAEADLNSQKQQEEEKQRTKNEQVFKDGIEQQIKDNLEKIKELQKENTKLRRQLLPQVEKSDKDFLESKTFSKMLKEMLDKFSEGN